MDPTSSQEVNNGQNNSDSVLKASMNGGENEVEVNGKDSETGVEDDDDEQPPPLQDVAGGDGNKSSKKYNLDLSEKDKVANEDGWVDILDNGQLLKKVLKEGTDETRPQRSCKVVVNLKTKIKEIVMKLNGNFQERLTTKTDILLTSKIQYFNSIRKINF